jgi:DNA-directed RNA polymerase subunit M/transcription elongation factor TFIIS
MLGKHKQTLKEKIQRKKKLREDIDNVPKTEKKIEIEYPNCPKCNHKEIIYNMLGDYGKCAECETVFVCGNLEILETYDEAINKHWIETD